MHMCKTIRLPGLVRQGCRATAQVELELGQDVINHGMIDAVINPCTSLVD